MLICEKPLQAMIEGFPYLSAEYRIKMIGSTIKGNDPSNLLNLN